MKFKKIKRPKIRMRRPRVRIRWRKKTSKWIIGAVVLFFISLFSFQLVLMNYAKSILQNILNLQVEKVTNGLYTSSFEDIEISYTKKNLLIKNLHLKPQTSSETPSSPEDEVPEAYDVFIPEVKINGINLKKAYWQNFVDIQNLELVSPHIILNLNLDDPESKTGHLLKKDLSNLLPSGIDKLRVGTVRIQRASALVTSIKKGKKSTVHIPSLDLDFQNFLLDLGMVNDPEKFFNTDRFFFEADSIKGNLADSTYRLSLETLKISSADSSAFARNMRLIPIKEPADMLGEDSIRNIYQMEFPLVYVYGLSLNDLYHSRDLITKEVTVVSPSFKMVNLLPVNPGQKENLKLEDLYPAIDKVLNSVQVKDLFLKNGKVDILDYNAGLQEKLSTEILRADIHHFVLDSNAASNYQKLLYSDRIVLNLQNYSLRLSDERHLMQAEELMFNSEEKEISARGFKVVPHNLPGTKASPEISYRAGAPLIHLHGVDMLEAYNNNNLYIDSLQLKEPSLSLTRHSDNAPDSQNNFKEEDLYGLVEDFLYTLHVDKISLQKGSFKIRKGQNSEDAFFTQIRRAGLWNFRLDSASAYKMNKLFYADNFELEIEDYEHVLPDNVHRIKADAIGISTLTDRIYISDLKIFAENKEYPYSELSSSTVKTLLNIEVPTLALNGVDILKAYLHKELLVKQVEIPGPKLQLGSFVGNQSERINIIKSSALYDLMKEYLEVIQVENLQLQEGQLDLAFYAQEAPLIISGENTNISISNFRFDSLTSTNPKRLFFADNVFVQMEGYETYLPDGIHLIKAENFVASTEEQLIMAEGVDVQTRKDGYSDDELLVQYKRKGYLNLRLPEIKLTGVDYNKAYYDEELRIDTIFASQPEVRYTYIGKSTLEKGNRKINLKQNDFYQTISPYFQLLAIENLLLENGRFSAVKQEGNQKEESTSLKGISLQMAGYLVDSSRIENSQHFLYAEDIQLAIQEYKQELLDDVHTLNARNLALSTSLQQVMAEEVQLKPKEKIKASPALTPNRYYVKVPAIQIKGIGFDKVYKDNQLVIDQLMIQEPEIKIRHTLASASGKPTGEEKPSLKNYDLYELIKGNLESLEVKSAVLADGKGEYIQGQGEKKFRFTTKDFSAQVRNFKLDEKGSQEDKLFNAEDVQVVLKNYERKLADSLHLLSIQNLSFSTLSGRLAATNMELVPRSGPDIYARMEKKNTDKLFRIRIPEGEFLGLNPAQLENDSLLLEKILIQSPEIEVIHYTGLRNEKRDKEEDDSHGLPKQLLQVFNFVQSDLIQLQDGSMVYTTLEGEKRNSFRIGNIKGIATNFKLDSISLNLPERIFYSDRLQFQVKDYSTKIDDNLYELRIADVQIDSKGRKLQLDSLMIIPLVDREVFAKEKGYETDQFTFWNKTARIKNLNFEKLFSEGNIVADSLLMEGFRLHVYRDKRQPFPENNFPKMPQEMIRNIQPEILLRGMAIRNGYISYEEQAKGAREPGFIDLTDVEIVSDTITNKPELLKKGLITNFMLDCYLMGTGHLQAYFKIPMGDTLNRHTYYGTLDEMYLPDFNPILEKTVFIKIRDGYANKIYFEVKADKENAEGQMAFQYRDLKVALVNKKTGKTGGPVKELGSLIANLFVVNTHNTEGENKPVRQGEIAFARDERRSVVNYWVKTMVNGFKSSIGL